MSDSTPRELLASLAHSQWSGWMEYLFSKSSRNISGSVTIPPDLVTRWQRQMNTDYTDLSEDEKESDRREANETLEVVVKCLTG